MENLCDQNCSAQEKSGVEEFGNIENGKHIENETAEEGNDIRSEEIEGVKSFDVSTGIGEELEKCLQNVSKDNSEANDINSFVTTDTKNDETVEFCEQKEVKKVGKKKKLKKFKNMVNKKRKREYSSDDERIAENQKDEEEIEKEKEEEEEKEKEKEKEEQKGKAKIEQLETKPLKKKKKKTVSDSYVENEFIDDVAEEKECSEDNETSEKEQGSNEDLRGTEHSDEKQNKRVDNKIKSTQLDTKKKSNIKEIDEADEFYFDERRSDIERSDAEKSETNKLKKKKTHFDEILENLKLRKKKKKNVSDDDCLQYCENVLKQMISAHEQDVKSIKANKPATAKLQMVDNICKILTKPKWKPYFMKLNINRVLEMWLMPLTKNSLPHFSIRSNILKVIMQLPFTIKSLRGSQLGKVLTYLHTHKDETEENKKLIKTILQNLLGPIIGINANYKHSLKKRQKKIMENPNFHKIILEKAKTLIPEKISIEKEEEQNECKRHVTVPFNSECSFLINVASAAPTESRKMQHKSKMKRLTDNFNFVNRMKKSQTVAINGKELVPAP